MKTGTPFKLFCFFTVATLLISAGIAASNAINHGWAPTGILGQVVNTAGKANAVAFSADLQVVARNDKSDPDRRSAGPLADAEPARGGTLVVIAADVASAALAQTVVRERKTSRIRSVTAAGTAIRMAANRTGKTDRLERAVPAQFVMRGGKADPRRLVVASLASDRATTKNPSGPAVEPLAGHDWMRTAWATYREPVVFVPVTLMYQKPTGNLAEQPPPNATSKTLWD